MKEIVIKLENVTKHYSMGDAIVKAVDGISIDIVGVGNGRSA